VQKVIGPTNRNKHSSNGTWIVDLLDPKWPPILTACADGQEMPELKTADCIREA